MRKRTYPTEELTDTRETKKGRDTLPNGKGRETLPNGKGRETLPNGKGRETLPDGLLDMSPALRKDELSELEAEMINATPEQFQQMLGKMYRIMLVRGLKDVPRPKSIKEIQALNDMIRRSEGVEARERGGGTPAGGFLPRVVGRKKVMVVDMETEKVVDTGEAGTVETVDTGKVVEATVVEPAPEPSGDPTPDPIPDTEGFF
jgi:hypothetical protein